MECGLIIIVPLPKVMTSVAEIAYRCSYLICILSTCLIQSLFFSKIMITVKNNTIWFKVAMLLLLRVMGLT